MCGPRVSVREGERKARNGLGRKENGNGPAEESLGRGKEKEKGNEEGELGQFGLKKVLGERKGFPFLKITQTHSSQI